MNDYDINTLYPYMFNMPIVNITKFTIIDNAIVDGDLWYTLHVKHIGMISFLNNKEKSGSKMVRYLDSPNNGGDIYDIHESIFNLMVLKYGN